jgi:hypothetical protein
MLGHGGGLSANSVGGDDGGAGPTLADTVEKSEQVNGQVT